MSLSVHDNVSRSKQPRTRSGSSFHRNEAGESLIAVLVAVGIAAIVILGTMTQMTYALKGTRTVDFRLEAADITNHVRIGLGTKACKLNLDGDTLPAVGGSYNKSPLYYANLAGTALNTSDAPIVAIGHEFPRKSKVTEISIHTTNQLTSTTYQGHIQLTLENNGAETTTLKRTIPISITVNGSGQITNCSPMSSGGGSVDLPVCPAGNVPVNGEPSGTCPAMYLPPAAAPEDVLTATFAPSDIDMWGCTWMVRCECQMIAGNPQWACTAKGLGGGASGGVGDGGGSDGGGDGGS